jgi:polyhydroxyalkanoate synthesis regulator protein
MFPFSIFTSNLLENSIDSFVQINKKMQLQVKKLFENQICKKAFTYLFWVYVGLKFKYAVRITDEIPPAFMYSTATEKELRQHEHDNEKAIAMRKKFVQFWFRKFVHNFGFLYRTEI